MSDLTLPEPTLPEPHRRDGWMAWTALASVTLHAGVLAVLLWQPLPESAEAAQPPAIDVELVPPPEAASEPAAAEEPAPEEPAAAAEPAAPAETPAASQPAETASPAEEPTEETPPEVQAAETGPDASAAAAAAAPEAASAAAEPPQGAVDPTIVAPTPLPRPKVRGLTAPTSTADEVATAPTADAGGMGEGAEPAPSPEQPDAAMLELGAPRSADRFYLEAMLGSPGMAAARDMIETLPPEKRLAQTCNIEALAQVGNSGEGYAPDVVMAEAYALQEMTGSTHLVANGAIFRSGDKWYGLGFDCTLSDDLTRVTAFSYRLGADVTEAVLARLNRT